MNRQQKRNLAKKINTPEKLEQLVDQLVRERTSDIQKTYNKKLIDYIEVFVVMTSYVLESEDIPKERIPQIASRVLFNIDSFRTGELKPEDYDVIKKEVESWGVVL